MHRNLWLPVIPIFCIACGLALVRCQVAGADRVDNGGHYAGNVLGAGQQVWHIERHPQFAAGWQQALDADPRTRDSWVKIPSIDTGCLW